MAERVTVHSDHGMLTGFLNRANRAATIDSITVEQGRQGQGGGSRLVWRFEQAARGWGVETISLKIHDRNPSGIRFWERLGFTAGLATCDQGFFEMNKHLDAPSLDEPSSNRPLMAPSASVRITVSGP